MTKKLIGGVLALILLGAVVANAAESASIEVWMRNTSGTMSVVNAHPAVKTEADGSIIVSFQAEKDGTYSIVYTSGPKKGHTATKVNVSKPGPVTARIKS